MPIKKRRNVPLPTRVVARPDQLGTPTTELIKKYDKLASDAEWDGQRKLAHKYTVIAFGYRKRLEAGEHYIQEDDG